MALKFETHEQCEYLTSTMMETALSDGVRLKPRHYGAGLSVWRIGTLPDCVYRLKEGRVHLVSVDTSGNELLLRTLRPGETFGEVCFCEHRHEPDGIIARTVTPCEILQITYNDFRRSMRHDPELAESVLKEFCERLAELERRTQILALHDATHRLKQLLLHLARSKGARSRDARGNVCLTITHSELAAMSALSRPHVSLLMTRFRKRGWVSYRRNSPVKVHLDNVNA
jgi:CRP/FNR family transcriptional regulator, cyclic AMP receptor protein